MNVPAGWKLVPAEFSREHFANMLSRKLLNMDRQAFEQHKHEYANYLDAAPQPPTSPQPSQSPPTQPSSEAIHQIKKALDHDLSAAIDAASEQAFWDFDAHRKRTGEERIAFKTSWREAFDANKPTPPQPARITREALDAIEQALKDRRESERHQTDTNAAMMQSGVPFQHDSAKGVLIATPWPVNKKNLTAALLAANLDSGWGHPENRLYGVAEIIAALRSLGIDVEETK